MKGDINLFLTYLENEKNSCLSQAAELKSDNRLDESNLNKIKANVFDIFMTLLNVLLRNDPENVYKNFLNKLDTIPQSWKLSLENAKKYEDFQKEFIEQIKLETVETIKNRLKEMCGES